MTVVDKEVALLASPIVLRPSNDDDVPTMLDIYRHHIAQGVGNLGAFEPTPFDADDLKARRRNMRKHKLPHLVATIDGVVAGYAYAVLFHKRPAYRFTVKHSIYVHPDRLRTGVGRALLPALIQACGPAGFRQMIGYIDSQCRLASAARGMRLSAGRLSARGGFSVRRMDRHRDGSAGDRP
jgi:L-amino acid N-acyltransferase YncA